MACLEAAMAEHMESVVQSRAEGASKVRLVADPMITVSQIQDIFQNYMTYKKTGDLWSLVCLHPVVQPALGGTLQCVAPGSQGHWTAVRLSQHC